MWIRFFFFRGAYCTKCGLWTTTSLACRFFPVLSLPLSCRLPFHFTAFTFYTASRNMISRELRQIIFWKTKQSSKSTIVQYIFLCESIFACFKTKDYVIIRISFTSRMYFFVPFALFIFCPTITTMTMYSIFILDLGKDPGGFHCCFFFFMWSYFQRRNVLNKEYIQKSDSVSRNAFLSIKSTLSKKDNLLCIQRWR